MTEKKIINTTWILTATILTSGMAFLLGSSISIAIPTIQSYFQASITQIQWVVNIYQLALASLLLISGSLGDKFGRRKIFLLGIGVFTLASLLSSLSNSIDQLIFFQLIQGIGGAMMIPGSLAIINVSIPKEKRGKAIGLWSGFSGGIAALGPFLGGWLVENLGWQSIFYVNIPLAIIAIVISLKFINETKNNDLKALDIKGTLLILLGTLGIALGLMNGPVLGWNNPSIWLSLILGIIFFILFIFVEKNTKNPLVPLNIFKSKLVSGSNLVTLFVYFALNGMIFYSVLNFQQIQGYSPIYSGMALLPPIILITFLSGPFGGLADKIGPRLPMIIGPLIVALSMFLMLIPGVNANYFISFLPPLVLFGLGMAILIAPLTKSALSVDEKYSGAASGVNNAVARLAALLAIAVLGAFIISTFKTRLNTELKASSLNENEKNQIEKQIDKVSGIEIPNTFSSNKKTEASSIVNESYITGFRYAMTINGILCLIAVGISFITIKNSKK